MNPLKPAASSKAKPSSPTEQQAHSPSKSELGKSATRQPEQPAVAGIRLGIAASPRRDAPEEAATRHTRPQLQAHSNDENAEPPVSVPPPEAKLPEELLLPSSTTPSSVPHSGSDSNPDSDPKPDPQGARMLQPLAPEAHAAQAPTSQIEPMSDRSSHGLSSVSSSERMVIDHMKKLQPGSPQSVRPRVVAPSSVVRHAAALSAASSPPTSSPCHSDVEPAGTDAFGTVTGAGAAAAVAAVLVPPSPALLTTSAPEEPLRRRANGEKHPSIIMELLKQLKVGMDLHKITLPAFILEPKSLLEKISDYMSHPKFIIKCVR
ncbi:hypothetical protein H696_02438 [Fonticula alba]|uniref:Uncharacterized protein n=1 Tax=Fonticula alba TaxID=691883 RepID=A0A058ZAS3_FONAL|nr:hypothetical protein H696_02438 [Fonticula alba]KCV71494.1 hypothetical protein H696_02438 [Fonticula alba]|eukprot:XP_009494617.1 hypothetical protein H696_02438 [Fonticula alba]